MLSLLAANAVAEPIFWESLGLRPGIDLGFFTLRFYSLAYLLGVIFAYWHTTKMIKQPGAPMAQRHVDDLFFYCTLGVILGGRLGYAMFYQPELFTSFEGDGFVSWRLLRLLLRRKPRVERPLPSPPRAPPLASLPPSFLGLSGAVLVSAASGGFWLALSAWVL